MIKIASFDNEYCYILVQNSFVANIYFHTFIDIDDMHILLAFNFFRD